MPNMTKHKHAPIRPHLSSGSALGQRGEQLQEGGDAGQNAHLVEAVRIAQGACGGIGKVLVCV